MSELTDWERDRLAALERQLSVEDPELAARLAGPVRLLRPRAITRIAWALNWGGVVQLPCGAALQNGSPVLVAPLAVVCDPAPVARPGRGAGVPVPANRLTRLAAREGR